jgi:hypothetical protein
VASKARNKTSAIISPIAFAAVQKFDAVFAAERAINGLSPAERAAVRRKDIAPLVNDLIEWMKRERAKLSRHNAVESDGLHAQSRRCVQKIPGRRPHLHQQQCR